MTRAEQTLKDLVVLRNSVLGLAASNTRASDLQVRPWDTLWQNLVDMLEDIASQEHLLRPKGNALLDDVKAAIVRHIRQQTTKEHHEEVSALINTALEKPYKPAAHRSAHKMWVSRHRKLLKRQTHHEAKWLELSAAMGPAKPKP